MISYKPFWNTLHKQGITTYVLINDHLLSAGLLDQLRHDKPITTKTINRLCGILHCKVQDILVYIPDEE